MVLYGEKFIEKTFPFILIYKERSMKMNQTISFNLNQQLDANYILNRIGELVRSVGDPKDKILIISIKTVEQEAIMLPLLEDKR